MRITEQRLILTVKRDKKERFQQICYQILIIFVEHSHSLFYTWKMRNNIPTTERNYKQNRQTTTNQNIYIS